MKRCQQAVQVWRETPPFCHSVLRRCPWFPIANCSPGIRIPPHPPYCHSLASPLQHQAQPHQTFTPLQPTPTFSPPPLYPLAFWKVLCIWSLVGTLSLLQPLHSPDAGCLNGGLPCPRTLGIPQGLFVDPAVHCILDILGGSLEAEPDIDISRTSQWGEVSQMKAQARIGSCFGWIRGIPEHRVPPIPWQRAGLLFPPC